MARQRKLTKERKELIGQLLATYQPEDAGDVQSMLKDLLGDTLQGMLEAELEDDLGYSRYDYANKKTTYVQPKKKDVVIGLNGAVSKFIWSKDPLYMIVNYPVVRLNLDEQFTPMVIRIFVCFLGFN